jgi:hypothetical protein
MDDPTWAEAGITLPLVGDRNSEYRKKPKKENDAKIWPD